MYHVTTDALQPPDIYLSGWIIEKLTKCKLLSRTIPLDTVLEKTASIAIKVFLAALFTLTAIVDLAYWSLRTVTIIPIYLRGFKNHLHDLRSTLLLPITTIFEAIFYNQLPTVWSTKPWTQLTGEDLEKAIKNRELDKITECLEAGVKPNGMNMQGKTPLTMLAEAHFISDADMQKRIAIAKVLVEHGAGIDRGDAHGRTPLGWAAFRSHTALVAALIELGADVNCREDSWQHGTPLTNAISGIKEEDQELVKLVTLILDKGANPNQFGCDWYSPLVSAIRHQRPKICELLIERGADPFLKDKSDNIPLLAAGTQKAESIFTNIATKLLAITKDPDAVIQQDTFTNCSLLALITVIAASRPKESLIGLKDAVKPLDTSTLANVWKLLQRNLPAATAKHDLLGPMSNINLYNNITNKFQDPYFQAINLIFDRSLTALFTTESCEAWRKWIQDVSTEAMTKTTDAVFQAFEINNRDMSKDLCRLIASYAQLDPVGTVAK